MKKLIAMAGTGILTLVLSAPFVLPNIASATPALARGDKVDTETNEFVKKASLGNLFEVETSTVATRRGHDQKVKNFAQEMIQDHNKANDDLRTAVRNSGVDSSLVVDSLDEKHQKKLDDLNQKNGENFDEEYLDLQEDAHDEAIELFEDYAKDGNNQTVRTFAQKTLPTLKKHKEHLDELN